MINLAKAQLEKSVADFNYSQAKIQAHKNFVQQNKTIIRLLDVLFIIAFLANFGALIATNYLSASTAPKTEFYAFDGTPVTVKNILIEEVNPAQQSLNNYSPHPQTRVLWPAIAKQLALWIFISYAYIYSRRSLMTSEQLTSLIAITVTLTIILCWDLTNDAAYLISLLF